MSVHCNIIPNYSQHVANFLDLFIFTNAVHVSGSYSAHHQEHTSVHTDSGIVNQYYCLLLPAASSSIA
jgi:5-deoxy-D-glucuronate isomerase